MRCSSQVAAQRADASELAASAAVGMSGDLSPDGIGIVVALGPDGTTVALCLGGALMARRSSLLLAQREARVYRRRRPS